MDDGTALKAPTADTAINNRARKLTAHDVIELRTMFANGSASLKALADRYNVSKAALWRIVRGMSWKGVGGPVVDGQSLPEAQRRWTARITAADVVKIKALREQGRTQAQIAEYIGIHQTKVGQILNGRLWAEV